MFQWFLLKRFMSQDVKNGSMFISKNPFFFGMHTENIFMATLIEASVSLEDGFNLTVQRVP